VRGVRGAHPGHAGNEVRREWAYGIGPRMCYKSPRVEDGKSAVRQLRPTKPGRELSPNSGVDQTIALPDGGAIGTLSLLCQS
jgi:hypothetical protein